MLRHPAAHTALDCLDIASVIVGFINLHALLTVLLSCSRLRDGVRRILGPDRSLASDRRHFVSSSPLTQWAMGMGCGTEGLCNSAACSGSMDVLKWLLLVRVHHKKRVQHKKKKKKNVYRNFKNRQNFTSRPIYMQLCIFYLLTVRRQENKVFSAAFAAENTRFPAGGSK
jgi:hypothetical protein